MKILKKMLYLILGLIVLLAIATVLFVQQAAFGQKPTGDHLLQISKSPYYKDNIFQNLEITEMNHISYPKLIKAMFFDDASIRSPKQPLPSEKNNLDYPNTQRPKITWFGHSTVLLQMEGKNILIDPIFSQRASPVQYIGSKNYEGTAIYNMADLPPIDIVLISHDHYDHLDYETILQLKGKVKQFYTPLGVGSHLKAWGIDNFTELDWWQEVQITPEIMLAATPARHFSGRGLTDRFKTLWTSYVIKSNKTSIYFSGDSGYGTHFKAIGEKYGAFDFTMMEAGQYNTMWAKIHLMPEETIKAHQDLNGKVMMPIHWGKFTLALHSWKDPIERIIKEANKQKVDVLTPIIGQAIVLDSLMPKKLWWETLN